MILQITQEESKELIIKQLQVEFAEYNIICEKAGGYGENEFTLTKKESKDENQS